MLFDFSNSIKAQSSAVL